MILVAGIPTEPPLADVIDALHDRGADVTVLNQRQFDDIDMSFVIDDAGNPDGLLNIGRASWLLHEIQSVYIRLMDDRRLPELEGEPDDSPRRHRCRALHDTLVSWTDITPSRVINRTAAMATNASKPFQAQLITAHGFETPETLITNDPVIAREFCATHARVVFKSISGVRSIVREVTADDIERLDEIRFCPVQFQEHIDGVDVRVHVVGTEVFASEIRSQAVDYRYAAAQTDSPATMQAIELPPDLVDRCVALTASLGLEFSGIDLSFTQDGRTVCFEVNPSPGYTYFEAHTQQPIAASVARLLDQ
jgi:hypothetical protein